MIFNLSGGGGTLHEKIYSYDGRISRDTSGTLITSENNIKLKDIKFMALLTDSDETIPFSFSVNNICIFTKSRLKGSGEAIIGFKGDVDEARGEIDAYTPRVYIYFIDNTIIIGGGGGGYYNTTNAKLIILT